jgi:hypothetical protein
MDMLRNRTVRRAGLNALLVASTLLSTPLLAQDIWPESNIYATDLPPYATIHDGAINREAIPMAKAVLGLFVAVLGAEGDRPSGGRALLQDLVGLDERSSEILFHYIRSAYDYIQHRSVDRRQDMCARWSEINTTDRFVSAIVRMEEEEQAELEYLMHEMSVAIGDDAAEIVIRWVDEELRPSLTMVAFDREQQLQQVDANLALARLCGAPNTPEFRRGP